MIEDLQQIDTMMSDIDALLSQWHGGGPPEDLTQTMFRMAMCLENINRECGTKFEVKIDVTLRKVTIGRKQL